MKKKLSVIFSSHYSEEENNKFISHLKNTAGIPIHVEYIVNMNEFSLSEAYNMGWKTLDKLGIGKDIIIFLHNDILIRTKDWGKKIVNIFNNNNFDIIGLAGSTKLPKHGCWWLTEDEKEMNIKKMYGRVYHNNGIRVFESIYSKEIKNIKEVVVVDGVFICVNGETIINRFDERFKGFHYYDLGMVFSNYLDGCNIGVIDKISIIHNSIGQTNTEWDNNRKMFSKLYKDELPREI